MSEESRLMGMSVSQDHCEIQVLVFSLVFPFFTTVLIFGVCSVSPTPLCSSSEERKGREMSRASYLLLSELHRNLMHTLCSYLIGEKIIWPQCKPELCLVK